MPDENVRRYGLIGAGAKGQEHIRALTQVAGANLVAIAEPDTEPLNQTLELLRASQFSPAVYSDWREMIVTAELDAVIITTPSSSHFEILTEAMKTDLALFVEAPLGGNLKEAKQIAKLAAKRQTLLQVGLDYRTLPAMADFVGLLQNDQVGAIRLLSIQAQGLTGQAASLADLCGDYFDLMRWVLQDEPVRVFASAGHALEQPVGRKGRKSSKALPVFDHATVIVEFAKGARAQLNLSLFGDPRVDVLATGETANLNVQVSVEEKQEAATHGLRSFHQAAAAGEKASVSADDGLRAIMLGLAAQQSAVSGKAVSV